METLPVPHIYFFAANLVFILSSAICAYMRWVHTCPEFSKNETMRALHYPARKPTIIFGLLLMLDFPYLLNVFSFDALLYTRAYSIISYPIFAVLLLRLFFFYKRFSKRVVTALVLIVFACMAPLFYFAMRGGAQLTSYSTAILWVASIIGGGVFLYGFVCIYKDLIEARKQDEKEFSNPDDFPSRLARAMLWFVPFYILLCVILPAFFDSGWVKLARDLSYACGNIWLIGHTLQSQRPNAKIKDYGICGPDTTLAVIEEETYRVMESGGRQTNGKHVETANKQLFEKILKVLAENEMYKQPSLMLDDLVLAVGSNRKYVSQAICNSPYLSFYRLINTMRVLCALELKEKYPEMKQDELATQAGFNSRFVLARWIKKFSNGELILLEEKMHPTGFIQ